MITASQPRANWARKDMEGGRGRRGGASGEPRRAPGAANVREEEGVVGQAVEQALPGGGGPLRLLAARADGHRLLNPAQQRARDVKVVLRPGERGPRLAQRPGLLLALVQEAGDEHSQLPNLHLERG